MNASTALQKILYIDRDGTLIVEPYYPASSPHVDGQIDSLDKLALIDNVIPSLLALQKAGFTFIMLSNQDGLGTARFAQDDFDRVQAHLMQLLNSQGIHFSEVRICPHLPEDNCECRKPKLGLVEKDLVAGIIDRDHSYVIGDRASDQQLAERLGLPAFVMGPDCTWKSICQQLLTQPRTADVNRKTSETHIKVNVNLDQPGTIAISTGIGFFDHMLEQIAKHGQFSCTLNVSGDLHIDDHHTIEDTALSLGAALRQALGDKAGIGRYGFLLPMDESLCEAALDISGRAYFVFEGAFTRERVGELSTELVPHFFRSFSEALGATLHIKIQGDNAHHMIEACFKAVGRCLAHALAKRGDDIPSTKGCL